MLHRAPFLSCDAAVHDLPSGVVRPDNSITPLLRLLSAGDSHTSAGGRYNTVTHNHALTASAHWPQAGLRLRRALAFGRTTNGDPNATSRAYCYAQPGARTDQIAASVTYGLQRLIENYGDVAESSIVVWRSGGNDFAAGASLATLQARIEDVTDQVLGAGFAAIVFVSQGPRLYSASPIDEAVILPLRLAFNEWLEDTHCPSDSRLYFCNINDIGEDPGNPGYALASKFDALAPGHCYSWVASRQGQALANVIATIPGVPTEPAWADAAFFSSALNATANNPNGNPLMSGTGTEGSPVVCAGARMQVDSGAATWAWSTVTRAGRTVRKLDILTNSGVVSLQTDNASGGQNAFNALPAAFTPATDGVYGTCSLEGEQTGWAFTEVKLELLQFGGSFYTSSDGISDDNGASGIIEPLPRSMLSTPPMVMGGSVGCAARLKFRGTGTVYLDWMTVHAVEDHPGPYTEQHTPIP